MRNDNFKLMFTRRQFLKGLTVTGALLYFGSSKTFSTRDYAFTKKEIEEFSFQYRTLSVSYLKKIKDHMKKLEKQGKYSNNKTFLEYIHNRKYHLPEELPNAKSIIIMAIPIKIALVNFRFKGKKHEIVIPPGYVSLGLKKGFINEVILKKILKRNDRKLVKANLPLKLLTARSGLGKYGKNNITYIEGMGSYYHLTAFYTDHEFPDDNWELLRMLRPCKGCYICMKRCPTQAITEQNFVIKAGKCITLYNELSDPIPGWIKSDVHHTLVGCMRCQYECPANLDYNKNTELLADISEEETTMIMSGNKDKKLWKSVQEKLKRFGGSNDFFYFSRNLRLVINNHQNYFHSLKNKLSMN